MIPMTTLFIIQFDSDRLKLEKYRFEIFSALAPLTEIENNRKQLETDKKDYLELWWVGCCP